MKTCRHCGELKQLSEFYSHYAMRDGHLNQCKTCVRRRIQTKVEQIGEQRRPNPERDAKRDARAKRWKEENPQGRRAHNAVNNAIRDGRLVREPCEICGEKAHAHHEDYSRPLKVRWLCPRHHQREHYGVIPF